MRALTATGLLARYRRELEARGWRDDPAQVAAIAALERLRDELLRRQRDLGPFGRLRRRVWPRHDDAPRGLYLWGGVGRGKTWLMDLFFASLPHTARRRSHFHHLMREIHSGLATLQLRQDPLKLLARRMARRAGLWCLDELHVDDIADAMLLSSLFEELLRQGVSLVITSNVPPSGLYREGLQRARFLPAVALLEQRLEVLQIDAGVDYRLRQLRQAPIYLAAADQTTLPRLNKLFAELAGTQLDGAHQVLINGRTLNALRRAGGVVWFSFATLCDSARNAADYTELAHDFHTVFVTDIPVLHEPQDNAARRFVSLVDEFYDRGVKLVISAATTPAELYRGERLAFEFRRTTSRLIEMQSEQYLAREHLPWTDQAAGGTAGDGTISETSLDIH